MTSISAADLIGKPVYIELASGNGPLRFRGIAVKTVAADVVVAICPEAALPSFRFSDGADCGATRVAFMTAPLGHALTSRPQGWARTEVKQLMP